MQALASFWSVIVTLLSAGNGLMKLARKERLALLGLLSPISPILAHLPDD